MDFFRPNFRSDEVKERKFYRDDLFAFLAIAGICLSLQYIVSNTLFPDDIGWLSVIDLIAGLIGDFFMLAALVSKAVGFFFDI